jgi:chromosome segregation ATPase
MPHIKKIIMQGFKSFAHPTEILFEKGLNVIVGPNGAGKSNLADAICFVLGRLSIKSMRAMRASNLIFHGGKEGKAAPLAKVSMVFDNSDNTFSLLEKEVAISRIVKKNGSSVYKINNQTKTRQEVLELLAQAGVDPYGFNIILQAEINQFVKMHSEERRAIIEDIAGISIYEERKKKSLRELEKTEDKLKEVEIILNQRTAYLRNLDKERAQALKYENLKKAVRRYKACLLYKKVREKEYLGGRFNKKIEEKNKIIEKKGNKIKILKEATDKIKKEIEKIDEHVKSKSGLEQESLFKEISELKSESAVVKVRLETYKEQYSNIEKRISQLNNETSSIEKEIEKLEQEHGEEPEIVDYKTEIKEIVNQIKKAAANFSQISLFIEKIDNYKNELQKLIDEKDIYNLTPKLQQVLKDMDQECKKISKIGKIDISRIDKVLETVDMEKIPRKRDIDLEINLAKKEMDKIRNIIKKSTREKQDIKSFVEKLIKEKGIKEKEVFVKEKIGKRLTGEFQKLLEDKSKLNEQLKEQEKDVVGKETEIRAIEKEINNFKIEKAGIDAEVEAFSQDFQDYKDIEEKIKEISKGKSRFDFEKKLIRAEKEIDEIGSVNLRALEVYDKVKAEYDEISEKVNKLKTEKDEILKIIDEVDRKKKQSFMETFNKLNDGFGNNFIRLSDKGKALLELENKQDPFAGGVDIIVKIGRGKEVDASSLSGGEKVIVAISFIFAIQEFKPYCFYIFDEIDAALDKHNSERLSGLMKKYIKQSQYIIITHNDATIGKADTLYGAVMHNGISKIVSLKL